MSITDSAKGIRQSKGNADKSVSRTVKKSAAVRAPSSKPNATLHFHKGAPVKKVK